MGKKRLLRNNKGASLVLVLVAMLFVGIIGGIVLTLTVGNSKSTKTTVDTSENFYTSESALDDFQMYIKKIATSAATQAYADTLEDTTITDANFTYHFKKQLYEVLQNSADSILNKYGEIDADTSVVTIDPNYIKNQISAGRSDKVNIKISDIEWNYDPNETEPGIKEANLKNTKPVVLKGVEVSLLDASGYETKLTVNVNISVNLPKTEWEDTSGEFEYDIDHYVMIAGSDIGPKDSYMSGAIKGSIYTYGDLNIWTETPGTVTNSQASDRIDIKADTVVVGGDINVNGRLDIAPINDANVSLERKKTEKSGSGEDVTETTRTVGVEVWCEGIKVSGPDSVMTVSRSVSSSGEVIEGPTNEIYFRKTLELNGRAAKFTAACDRLYGYSGDVDSDSNTNITGRANLLSSAIILNGLGANLNLSNVEDLQLAGTAYTALPSVDGVNALYEYYNGNGSVAEPSDLVYYTQGESITYRSLQALYLVPGDFIKGIGHNPMKYSEYQSLLKTVDGKTVINEVHFDMDKAKDYVGKYDSTSKAYELLKTSPFNAHIVRYMDAADQYVYIFWNFKTPDDAAKYFNRITATNKKYEGLFGKQLEVLNENSGSIILPDESNVKTAGNALYYDSEFDTYLGKDDISLSKYENKFKGMKSELNESVKIEGNLIDTMFNNKFDSNHLANKSFAKKLPFGTLLSPDETISYKEHSDSDRKYFLITGSNVWLEQGTPSGENDYSIDGEWTKVFVHDLSEYSFIIVSPGNVKIASTGSFRGMIIAGGSISVADDLNMECLGMVTRTPSNTNEEETISEFKALLRIKTGVQEENPYEPVHANNRLEAVFNVFDNSGSTGGKGNEFVSVNVAEFERN